MRAGFGDMLLGVSGYGLTRDLSSWGFLRRVFFLKTGFLTGSVDYTLKMLKICVDKRAHFIYPPGGL